MKILCAACVLIHATLIVLNIILNIILNIRRNIKNKEKLEFYYTFYLFLLECTTMCALFILDLG